MASKLNSAQAKRLGTQLRLARLSRALSMQDMASQCGMHHSQLSRLERGMFNRLSGNVQNVCRYLHIKPYESMATSADVAQLHARLDALASRDPQSTTIVSALLDVLDSVRKAV